MKKLLELVRRAEGYDLAEYALFISFIALVALAAASVLGNRIAEIFAQVAGAF